MDFTTRYTPCRLWTVVAALVFAVSWLSPRPCLTGQSAPRTGSSCCGTHGCTPVAKASHALPAPGSHCVLCQAGIADAVLAPDARHLSHSSAVPADGEPAAVCAVESVIHPSGGIILPDAGASPPDRCRWTMLRRCHPGNAPPQACFLAA